MGNSTQTSVKISAQSEGRVADAELNLDESQALALLLRRLSLSLVDVRGCADDEEEADLMLRAVDKLKDALGRVGCEPKR